MKKTIKIIAIIIASLVALYLLWLGFFLLSLRGTFDVFNRKEISTYTNPDTHYVVVFEQIGDPDWPFGSTTVQLTLKNSKGKKIDRIETRIANDGKQTTERNVKDVSWKDNEVIITLTAEEMSDYDVVLKYNP
ncbi:MAG: hypothetical protein E7574_02030 [Ruminococcaceae bacterium]|nr:hypothetical protein [Oscillospiraceae bacterium]